jgi:hypothetical protein
MRLKPLKISWKKLEQKLKLNKRNQTFFKVVWFRILSRQDSKPFCVFIFYIFNLYKYMAVNIKTERIISHQHKPGLIILTSWKYKLNRSRIFSS